MHVNSKKTFSDKKQNCTQSPYLDNSVFTLDHVNKANLSNDDVSHELDSYWDETVANLTCSYGYRFAMNEATVEQSTCMDGNWTNVNNTCECKNPLSIWFTS